MVVKPIWLLMMKWMRAAGAVARRPDRPKHSATTPWPGEGRVAVDEQRHHRGAIVAASPRILVLLGARLAEHHRDRRSRDATVGGQRQVDLVAVELAVGRAPRWYFTSPEPSTSSGVDEPP